MLAPSIRVALTVRLVMFLARLVIFLSRRVIFMSRSSTLPDSWLSAVTMSAACLAARCRRAPAQAQRWAQVPHTLTRVRRGIDEGAGG